MATLSDAVNRKGAGEAEKCSPKNEHIRSTHAPLPKGSRIRIIENKDDRLTMIIDPAPNRLAFETIAGSTVALGLLVFFVMAIVIPMMDFPNVVRDSIRWMVRDENIWAVVMLLVWILGMSSFCWAALYLGLRARFSTFMLVLQPDSLIVQRLFWRGEKHWMLPLQPDCAAWVEKTSSYYSEVAFGRREAFGSSKKRLRFGKTLDQTDKNWLANEVNEFFGIHFVDFPRLTFRSGHFEYSPSERDLANDEADDVVEFSTARLKSRESQHVTFCTKPSAVSFRQRLFYWLSFVAGICGGVFCVGNLVFRWLPSRVSPYESVLVVTTLLSIVVVFAVYVAMTALFRNEVIDFDSEWFSYRWDVAFLNGKIKIPTSSIDEFTVISFSTDPRGCSDEELLEQLPRVSLYVFHDGGRRESIFKNLKRRPDIERIAAFLRHQLDVFSKEAEQDRSDNVGTSNLAVEELFSQRGET